MKKKGKTNLKLTHETLFPFIPSVQNNLTCPFFLVPSDYAAFVGLSRDAIFFASNFGPFNGFLFFLTSPCENEIGKTKIYLLLKKTMDVVYIYQLRVGFCNDVSQHFVEQMIGGDQTVGLSVSPIRTKLE